MGRARRPAHRRSRRRAALAGLVLSGAVAAGAVGAWFALRTPDTVPLVGPTGSAREAAAAPAPTSPPAPTAPSSATTVAPGPTIPPGAMLSPPVRIAIPSESIAAQIVPEGLDTKGSLVIPPPAQVGWYDGGPMPGQPGSTLLAGHIDDYGVPGAFLHLNAVQLGASVVVTTADGAARDYTVTERRSVPQAQLAPSGLLTSSGPARLVLVTCGGRYDESTHLYLDNIVLVAEPAASPAG